MYKINLDENKERYRELCNNEDSIPLFCKSWWLDSVADNEWNVVLYESKGKVIGALPYIKIKRFGFTSISQPVLTQHLGPWLKDFEDKVSTKLSREKEILQYLFSNLPPFSKYSQNWSHINSNWLPLYWLGYQQTTRYTYRIDNLKNLDEVWQNFDSKTRNEIRKAESRYNLIIKEDLDFEIFFNLNTKVFSRQNLDLPYSADLVKNIYNNCKNNNCIKTFIAVDSSNAYHAGVLVIWDKKSTYYLMGGGDPNLRNSGATSLCMWNAIKFAASVSDSFDFEGSIIEPIEKFIRGFGAKQTPYFYVWKFNSSILEMLSIIKKIF